VLPPALERGLRRFVEAAMYSPFSLPVMGASLLAAVAVGVHLGESSIGLINPIYFQAPPLHPRERGAAIDETSLDRNAPAYAQLYGWEQGYAARAADCGGCETVVAQVAPAYSARVPYFGARGDVHTALAQVPDDLGERFAEVPDDAAPRIAQVERYAHYPVSAEAAVTEPEPDPAPVAAEVKKGTAESF
jgi:hypothetical protein